MIPETRTPPRSLNFALFAIGLLWLLASRAGAESAAQGIARLLHLDALTALLDQLFLLLLLLTGFTALGWVGSRDSSVRQTNALPWRATARQEWQLGAALGWALLLVAVLPMALVGALHPEFWFGPRAWGSAALSMLVLFVGTLALEVSFRGFLFQRLIAATGPVTATVIFSGIYAFFATSAVNTTPFSFSVAFLAGVIFSAAYLRSHALWLGWGLHFAWLASMGVLFGLPVDGASDFASIVSTNTSGSVWLTGASFGPEGAFLTIFVLLGGTVILYTLTRDYAWQYTQPVIVPGGYPMDVPPPAAHAAMEAAPPPPKLVQILGATPVSNFVRPDFVPPPLPPPFRAPGEDEQ